MPREPGITRDYWRLQGITADHDMDMKLGIQYTLGTVLHLYYWYVHIERLPTR